MRFLPALFLLAACGVDPEAAPDAGTPLDAAPPDAEVDGDAEPAFRPARPDHDDPRYVVEGVPRWSIVGHDDGEIRVAVTAPEGTAVVGLWLDDEPVVTLGREGDAYVASLDATALAPGEHELLFAADWARTAFARRRVTRSHPYYAFVSTDWDEPDNADLSLDAQQRLHDLHPHLRLTHLVGPYTFTDAHVLPSRVDELVAWVVDMRDTYGDEIGLHIHPYCSFVDTTGVPCRTTPSVRGGDDVTGYSVVLSSYSQEEMETLLRAADDLFEAHGLGKPTAFRAGGWTAELHTLRALEATGYVVDASAVAWSRLEEWMGLGLYEWTSTHWSTIDETSQPYLPSTGDILETGPQHLDLLEVPDNGALVDYVSGNEMKDIFDANWDGEALAEPRVWSIGYHPPNFWGDLPTRMDVALAYADEHLAADDAGPVIYATASELPGAFPPGE